MRAWIRVACGLAALAAWQLAAAEGPAKAPSLADALAVIQSHRFVDLTHSFAPGIPHWKGAPDERVKTLYTVDKDGFRINEYCHIGQWGTHVDPPAHFHTGLHSVDQIDPKEMLMPLVVIDGREEP
jgi:kynurenine formamidase